MTDRLTLLSTFIRISERGSISAAARDLGLSQAAASRRLSELEKLMGAKLILRTTHDLSLTDKGVEALQQARVLVSDWEQLENTASGPDGELTGRLKIIAPVALGQLYLVQAALDFRESHPGVTLDWILTDEDIRFTEEGCDLWIRIGSVPDDRLIVKTLARVERGLVAAPDLIQAETVEDLAGQPFIALGPFEDAEIPLWSDDRKALLKADVTLRTNNIFSVKAAALKGLGYAVLPIWMVAGDLKSGRLVRVLPDWQAPQLDINMAYAPHHRANRKVEAFREIMNRAISAIEGIEAA